MVLQRLKISKFAWIYGKNNKKTRKPRNFKGNASIKGLYYIWYCKNSENGAKSILTVKNFFYKTRPGTFMHYKY